MFAGPNGMPGSLRILIESEGKIENGEQAAAKILSK